MTEENQPTTLDLTSEIGHLEAARDATRKHWESSAAASGMTIDEWERKLQNDKFLGVFHNCGDERTACRVSGMEPYDATDPTIHACCTDPSRECVGLAARRRAASQGHQLSKDLIRDYEIKRDEKPWMKPVAEANPGWAVKSRGSRHED